MLIKAFNGDLTVGKELEKIGSQNILVSSITEMELVQGMRNKNELAWMKARLKRLNVIDLDKDISRKA
ncbi:MAG: hypothetical protein AAFN92_03670, partial [Bacteroidota bacterium]